jgi:hypothetical protein
VGAFNEPTDVDELDGGVDDLARLTHLGQQVQPPVGHLCDTHVWVGGCKGIRRGEGAATGQGIKQR